MSAQVSISGCECKVESPNHPLTSLKPQQVIFRHSQADIIDEVSAMLQTKSIDVSSPRDAASTVVGYIDAR